jgi:hypothetical protein
MVYGFCVANCSIRAAKLAKEYQNMPMQTNEVEKVIWWNSVPSNRLNHRVYGRLKGKALTKAQRLVN